jgi:outer membrane protein TolC
MTFGGVNLTQPLLRGFGLGANLVGFRVARANRSISEWQYRQTLIETVTNAIVTYNALVLAHNNLRIARRYRDLGATLLKENLQRLKAGSGSQNDVVTARAQVAQREEAILLEENAVRSTDNQLRELMGENSFLPDRPLLNVAEPSVPQVTVDPEHDYQEALNRRPDYQAARLGITINRANSAAARVDPVVALRVD